ncbi:MAG: hypothetical protein RLO52_09995 [Sandaracinaceae bacterium]|nr:MAG: hypothetical protein EVA89_29735 [Sandaracinaceae bacterium]
MTSDRRAWLAVFALLAGVGCSDTGFRRVDLAFKVPGMCGPPMGDAGPSDLACPLGSVGSFRTELLRVDGTQGTEPDCIPALHAVTAAPLCDWDDLLELKYLRRGSPSDGVDILITGWTGPDCDGNLALRCESLGDGVIELGTIQEVAVWCDCPLISP